MSAFFTVSLFAGLGDDCLRAKIEGGVSGASFGAIERLASALSVDPAELFTTEALPSSARRQVFTDLTSRLAVLSDDELLWLGDIFKQHWREKGGVEFQG